MCMIWVRCWRCVHKITRIAKTSHTGQRISSETQALPDRHSHAEIYYQVSDLYRTEMDSGCQIQEVESLTKRIGNFSEQGVGNPLLNPLWQLPQRDERGWQREWRGVKVEWSQNLQRILTDLHLIHTTFAANPLWPRPRLA